jgi:branched-chain amino acid transport system substrate-binding protein
MNKAPSAILLIAAAAGLTLLISLAAVPFLAGSPLRIGFAGPLTGPYSDLGVAGRNGAQLAFEEMNAAGGLRRRDLRLEPIDDRGSDQGARQAARKLLESEVIAVIGHMTSAQCLAALPLYKKQDKVLLSPTASTPSLSRRKDLFFRIQPATDLAARAAASYIADDLKLRRLCIVYDLNNRAYTRPYVKDFQARATELGASVCQAISFSSQGKTDWQALTEKIRSYGPEALFIVASAQDTARLAQRLRTGKGAARLFSSEWARTEKLLQYGGDVVEGLTLVQLHSKRAAPQRFDAFARSYRERFGRPPNYAAAQGYNAARVLAWALDKAGLEAGKLPSWLPRVTELAGLYGPISLNGFGDFFSSIYLCRVENGSFVRIAKISPDRR